MKTGYFVTLAAETMGFKSRITSDKVFKITRDLKDKAIKAEASLATIKKEDKVVKEVLKDKDDNVTGTIEEAYPELRLQGKILATLNDGRVIVHAIIPTYAAKKTRLFLAEDVEDANPLTAKNAETLGIKDKFIGYTREDVFKKFPELEGNITTFEEFDGEQVAIDTPKLMKHRWSGE